MTLLKILFLIGVVYIVEKIFEKFRAREKLIRKLKILNENFTAYKDEMNVMINQYQSSYDDLVSDFKSYQADIEKTMSESNKMVSQILRYSRQMIQDNKRLYSRLDMVDRYLSSSNPSQEEQAELRAAIEEDIQLKVEYEKQLEEIEHALFIELQDDDDPEMRDDYE